MYKVIPILISSLILSMAFGEDRAQEVSPYDYPYGYPQAEYPLGGASHPRRSRDYMDRPANIRSEIKRVGQYALRRILVDDSAGAVEYLEGLLRDHPGRHTAEIYFMLTMAHAQLGDLERAEAHMDDALEHGLPPGRFIAGPRRLFAPLHDRPRYQRLLEQHRHQPIHGPMLGDITPHSAKVWVRTAQPTTIRVIASTDPQLDPVIASASAQSTEADDFTAVAQLEGLQANTRYYYGLLVGDASEPVRSDLQQFRTYPQEGKPARFTIAFGGCSGYNPEFERMWDTIRLHRPLAFLTLGDNSYIDDPESPDQQWYCYYQRHSRWDYRRFVGSTAVYAIWDDHDFGCDDSWGGPEIDVPYWKPMVLEIFQQNWVNPSYGLPDRPGVWFDFTVGDVHFIMLDGRYYREDNGRFDGDGVENPSMLGPHQLEWLLQTLADSTATVKVLVSPVSWHDDAKDGRRGLDSWRGFPQERERIFSFIRDNDIRGIVLLSSDRHRSDAWKHDNPVGYDLYEFTSGRLTNYIRHTLIPEALFGYNDKQSVGLLHFDTVSDPPSVTFDIVSIDNERAHTITIHPTR